MRVILNDPLVSVTLYSNQGVLDMSIRVEVSAPPIRMGVQPMRVIQYSPLKGEYLPLPALGVVNLSLTYR